MTIGYSPSGAVSPPNAIFQSREQRAITRYDRELADGRRIEIELREALTREDALLRQKTELVQQHEVLSKLLGERQDTATRAARLTRRERQVMGLILAGHPNKNIAADLGISQRTVENHRASIMKKTGSKSLPALDRFALAVALHGVQKSLPHGVSSVLANYDGGGSLPNIIFTSPERRMSASYERERTRHSRGEVRLRQALARAKALLCQKDELIQQQSVLSQESDHRLLNGLQMIVSLLSLQSRASTNAEVVAQLAAAADRVATIGRIQRRLHSLDGVKAFALKQYLEDLCRDFSMILSAEPRELVVEGINIELPAATAIPLGFIASELITNAGKYGAGRITVRLEAISAKGCALSVVNDGPALPEGFDPGAGKGLGMRIIRSLVKQIGGELQIDRGDKARGRGPRFTVLFA
jgi:two-component sensor histidine kinase